jgi:hypothetical protein
MRRLAGISLIAFLWAALPAVALARLEATVGNALGGAQKRGGNGSTSPALQRRYRGSGQRLGTGPQLTVTSAGQRVGYLDANHYQNVRDVAVRLLRKYTPDDHFFIGVGRSPVSLVTFMRELDDDLAMTFPASDMRLQIDPSWKQEYFEHFKQLIPKSVIDSKKTIVLFDRTREGKTLVRLKEYLREYLKSVGSKAKVRVIGLSDQKPAVEGLRWIDASAYPYLFKYALGQYDHDEAVAPFTGKHRIGVDPISNLTANPNHDRFRQAMRARMEDDAALDGILTKDFGPWLKP